MQANRVVAEPRRAGCWQEDKLRYIDRSSTICALHRVNVAAGAIVGRLSVPSAWQGRMHCAASLGQELCNTVQGRTAQAARPAKTRGDGHSRPEVHTVTLSGHASTKRMPHNRPGAGCAWTPPCVSISRPFQGRVGVHHLSALCTQLCQAPPGQHVLPHLHLRCSRPGQEPHLAAQPQRAQTTTCQRVPVVCSPEMCLPRPGAVYSSSLQSLRLSSVLSRSAAWMAMSHSECTETPVPALSWLGMGQLCPPATPSSVGTNWLCLFLMQAGATFWLQLFLMLHMQGQASEDLSHVPGARTVSCGNQSVFEVCRRQSPQARCHQTVCPCMQQQPFPNCTEVLLPVRVAQTDATAQDSSLAVFCCWVHEYKMPPEGTASPQNSPMAASLLPVVALLSSDARMPLPRVAMYPAGRRQQSVPMAHKGAQGGQQQQPLWLGCSKAAKNCCCQADEHLLHQLCRHV